MKEKDLIYENKAVKLYKFPNNTWKDLLGPTVDEKLQKKFTKILKNAPFDSYYFETPNIKSSDSPIEFALVESETLHNKKSNWKKYEEYMKKKVGKTATSFDNLSGEFRLTIPLNKSGDYGHLKDFMTNASSKEIEDILLEVGRQLKKYRKEKGPIYFSTHGDGVPWLHFRLGRVPRYYSYKPYAEKKKTKKKKGKTPTVTCIKVSELRKGSEKYDSLQEWIDANPHHLYIGRNMSFYVPGAYQSKWHNPYSIKKYPLEDSLRMYEEYIRNSELFDQLDELEGKILGCWCLPNTPCHGKVLVNLYKERFC